LVFLDHDRLFFSYWVIFVSEIFQTTKQNVILEVNFYLICFLCTLQGFWALMENSRFGAFLRSRRMDSFFSTSSEKRVVDNPNVSIKDESERGSKMGVFVDDDDGWVPVIISWIRIVTCFVSMMITTFIWALIMLVLIPWPYERIRQGNIYGHVTGRMLVSCIHFGNCFNFLDAAAYFGVNWCSNNFLEFFYVYLLLYMTHNHYIKWLNLV